MFPQHPNDWTTRIRENYAFQATSDHFTFHDLRRKTSQTENGVNLGKIEIE